VVKILCCTCGGKGLVDESRFRGIHARVLNIVRNSPQGITLLDLVDAVYADDENGGPLYANLVVQQIIRRINRRISVSGWSIKASKLGRGARYRMQRIVEPSKKTYRTLPNRISV